MSPVSSRTIRISSPATTSGLSVDASASSGKTAAGRRLANRFSSLRNRRTACSEQDGVGFCCELQRRRRQGIARGIIRCAADGSLLELELQAFAPEGRQHLDRLGDDLGADAVSGQNGNFHAGKNLAGL